ncbi:hypothetical protein SAMN02949497_3325 [Methylomagnum ishizawai]|uniref:SpoIIAA-like n=1 Tax=Methylomagnum ishizawai TaxID=1760988 RepID=A0A1Y6CZY1_9GAMM|nr:hypothetical protein [Methylomagnum ishizawai]SMF95947.1 hypothetical protein SAMN02949497_3325 [Methylomagnum ishizawai]
MWRVTYHSDNGVVEAVFGGELTPDELRTAVEATLEAARRHANFLVLADCLELRGGHSLFDLYALVDFLEASGIPPNFKEALLMPGAGREWFEGVEFWETACLNRGLAVRIFSDRAAALAWLLE